MSETLRRRHGGADDDRAREERAPSSRAGRRATFRTAEPAAPVAPAGPTTLRRARRGTEPAAGAAPTRSSLRERSFIGTLKALDALSSAGAHVSVRVADLDSGEEVLTGDDHLTLPVGGIGVVPLLIEVAAQIEFGQLVRLIALSQPFKVELERQLAIVKQRFVVDKLVAQRQQQSGRRQIELV